MKADIPEILKGLRSAIALNRQIYGILQEKTGRIHDNIERIGVSRFEIEIAKYDLAPINARVIEWLLRLEVNAGVIEEYYEALDSAFYPDKE